MQDGPYPPALPLLPVDYPSTPGPQPASHPIDIGALPVLGADGRHTTVGDILDGTETDAWLVLHDGVLVAEHYGAGVDPRQPRVLMSISKTVIGMLVGCLVEHGRLRPSDPVTRHVPELAATGYVGATVRDLLDMRSGVVFREEYTDPSSHIRHLDAALAGVPGAAPGLKAYLLGLVADRPHGGMFTYRSSDADVLGWVCERAAGATVPDLVGRLIWGPMGALDGAAFMADQVGTPVYDGGMLASARDLARFGEVLLGAGTAAGHEVLPRSWVAQVWSVDPELRAAFADSAAGPFLPGGWYRNQCWVVPGPHGDVLLGLGIYGQLLRVDPATRTVMVKLSSWQAPQDAMRLYNTLRAGEAVAAHVSGREPGAGSRFGAEATRRPPPAGL